MYPMGNISVKLGLEQLVSSNPRPHQNLIHFDLSKLAKRPLPGRDEFMDYRHCSTPLGWPASERHLAVKQPDRIAKVDQLVKFG